MTNTTAAYRARAAEYTARFGSMSAVHPSDRQVVESWGERVSGRVLDAGCGLGHWTQYLSVMGLKARGIDLVPTFINRARSEYPGIQFDLRSIEDIDEPDGSLDGVFSWFSTIHYEPEDIARPIAEFARVLRPGGELVVGFFSGSSIEPFDHAVALAYRWPAEALGELVNAAGFNVVEIHLRDGRGERPVGTIISERLPPAN